MAAPLQAALGWSVFAGRPPGSVLLYINPQDSTYHCRAVAAEAPRVLFFPFPYTWTVGGRCSVKAMLLRLAHLLASGVSLPPRAPMPGVTLVRDRRTMVKARRRHSISVVVCEQVGRGSSETTTSSTTTDNIRSSTSDSPLETLREAALRVKIPDQVSEGERPRRPVRPESSSPIGSACCTQLLPSPPQRATSPASQYICRLTPHSE